MNDITLKRWAGTSLAGAVFEAAETAALLASPLVPEDRRVLYGLMALAGLRPGEAVALRWEDVDLAVEPLGRITVHRSRSGPTKTGRPRSVPLHPQLASMLLRWRSEGLADLLGRQRRPDDFVSSVTPSVRRPPGRMRSGTLVARAWAGDLEALELRARRRHDLRRTFTSLARAAGARAELIDAVTHDRAGSIVDVYTTWPWETLCEAVALIDLDPPPRTSGSSPPLPPVRHSPRHTRRRPRAIPRTCGRPDVSCETTIPA